VIDRTSWSGGEEMILRHGSSHDTQIMILEPLFEEKNRTRRMITEIMRRLDGLGIGSALPDLPGTGESLLEVEQVSLSDWQQAVLAAAQLIQPVTIASFRGGAMLDSIGGARGVWRFAPETGARLIRDMERTRIASGEDGLLGGNKLSPAFVDELKAAAPNPVPNLRIVRLDSDAGEADLKVEGTPLWRRAEPDEAPALSAALAQDIADWTRICAAA
jgi:hypothetical protein